MENGQKVASDIVDRFDNELREMTLLMEGSPAVMESLNNGPAAAFLAMSNSRKTRSARDQE
jgi:hypothetical protein